MTEKRSFLVDHGLYIYISDIKTMGLIYPTCDCSRSNQKPYTGQLTEIYPYVRSYY